MPDDFDIKWNDEQILGSLVEPFHQANEALGTRFQNEITAKKWEWDGETDRKSGETATTPRDIVDLGDLRRSYVGEREAGLPNPEHSHTWNADHAMAVHEGAKFKDGRTMPGRDWTNEPLKKRVLETAFEKLAKAALGRIQ